MRTPTRKYDAIRQDVQFRWGDKAPREWGYGADLMVDHVSGVMFVVRKSRQNDHPVGTAISGTEVLRLIARGRKVLVSDLEMEPLTDG